MITDHKHREYADSIRPASVPLGGCAYLNCGRPREEHVAAAKPRAGRRRNEVRS